MKHIKPALLLGIIFSILLISHVAHATSSVQINEIAWMGTSASADAEWMELYNSSSSPVDLTGWKLDATDGTPTINLSGTIAANGYFLLERTSNTLPGLVANQIYTGALSNSGEHLQLIDNTGAIVDDVDASSGWPAGDDTTKDTMQWNGSSWITAVGTPDAANATVAAIISPSSTSSSSSSNSNSSDSSSQNSTNANQTESTGTEINVSASNQVTNVAVSATSIPVDPDPDYSATVTIPDSGTSGVAVPMSVSVLQDQHHDMVSGKFLWSYGDGASDTFLQNTPASHIYYYPGTYGITLTYYSNNLKTDPDYLFKKTITIIPAQNISISGTTDDQGVILQNNGTSDIDIEGWKLDSMGFEYVFPKYTIVPSSGNLYVSSHVIGFPIQNNSLVTLSNPSNRLISKYQLQETPNGENNSSQNQVLGISEINQNENTIPFLVSNTPIPKQPTIQEIPMVSNSNFWNSKNSTIMFVIALITIILAYAGFRLYAVRNSDYE